MQRPRQLALPLAARLRAGSAGRSTRGARRCPRWFPRPVRMGKPSVKADSPVRAAASPGQEAIESGPSRQHEGDGSDDPCERYKNLCPEHAFPSARHGRDASGAELRRDRDPGRVLMVAGRAAAARTSRAA